MACIVKISDCEMLLLGLGAERADSCNSLERLARRVIGTLKRRVLAAPGGWRELSFLDRAVVSPDFRRELEAAIGAGARRFQVAYCAGACSLSVLARGAARELARYFTCAEHARVARILDALHDSGIITVAGAVYHGSVTTLTAEGPETIIRIAVRKRRRDCRRP